MTAATSPAFHDPTGLEMRLDRSYDEQTPSHLLLPNGTSADFYDRALGNAMVRAALPLWDEWCAAVREGKASGNAAVVTRDEFRSEAGVA